MKLKTLSASLVILAILSTSFLPIFSKRAEAQFAVIDFAAIAQFIIKNGRDFADMGYRAGAQLILQQMIDSTTRWAQSGFRGGPAYAVDPKQFFTNVADGVAGTFISGTELGFLCSPFQSQIRLALKNSYTQPLQFQCTLTGVVGNINAFYGDFSQGGWDGWFSMTQNSSNNPYGSYVNAQVELDARIANAIGIENEQLNWGSGFLSFKNCLATNPPAGAAGHVSGVAVGACTREGPTKTPGVVIAEQLNEVLPANMNRFINAQHLEDLLAAFVTGALNRFVFGNQGLF